MHVNLITPPKPDGGVRVGAVKSHGPRHTMADHRAVHAGNSGLGAVLFVLAAIATVLGWTGTRAKTTTEPSPQEAVYSAADTLVAKLMRENVYSLSPNDTIRQALHMFVDKRISGAPLLSDDRTLAGFVSDGDVLDVCAGRWVAQPAGAGELFETTPNNSETTSPHINPVNALFLQLNVVVSSCFELFF